MTLDTESLSKTDDSSDKNLNDNNESKLRGVEIDEIVFSLLDVLGHAVQEQIQEETFEIITRYSEHNSTYIIKSILSFLEVSQINSAHQCLLLNLLRKIIPTEIKSNPNPDLVTIILNCHSFMLKELCFISTADSRHVEIKHLVLQIGILFPKECLNLIVSLLKKNKDVIEMNSNTISILLSLLDDICKHYPNLINNNLLLLFTSLLKLKSSNIKPEAKSLIRDIICTLHNLFLYKAIKPYNTKPIDFNISLYDPPQSNSHTDKTLSHKSKQIQDQLTYDGSKLESSIHHLTTPTCYQALEPLLIALTTEFIPMTFTPRVIDCDDSVCKAMEIASIIATHASESVWQKCAPELTASIVVRSEMHCPDLYDYYNSFPPIKTLDCQLEWMKLGNIKPKRDRTLLPQLISSIVSKNNHAFSESLKNSLINISLRPFIQLSPHILACSRDFEGPSLDKFYLFASRGILGTLSQLESEIKSSDADKLGKLTPPLVGIMRSYSNNKYIHYGVNRLVALVDKQVGKICASAFNYDNFITAGDGNPLPWGESVLKDFMKAAATLRLTHLPVSIASYLIVYSNNIENLVSANVALFKRAAMITGFDRIPGANLIPLAKCINSIRLPLFAYPFLLANLFLNDIDNSFQSIAKSSLTLISKALNGRVIEFHDFNDLFKRFKLTEMILKKAGLNNLKEITFPTIWFSNTSLRIPLLYVTILTSDELSDLIISNLLSIQELETEAFSLFKDVFEDLFDANDSELVPIASILAYKSSYCDKYFQKLLDVSSRKTSSFSIFTTPHVKRRNNFIKRLVIITLGLIQSDLNKRDEFITITKSDSVWRYFIDELHGEQTNEIRRCLLFSISNFLGKNFIKFPNFPHFELLYEFPTEGLNTLANLVLVGVKIPNLPAMVAKFLNLDPDSTHLDEIFESFSGDSSDFVSKLLYEVIVNGPELDSLSKYRLIAKDNLYRMLVLNCLDFKSLTKWHVLGLVKIALLDKYSDLCIDKLHAASPTLRLSDCTEALNHIALMAENASSPEETLRKILAIFLPVPKALHYMYNLPNIASRFKIMIISIVDASSLKRLVRWEVEMSYVEKTDSKIAKTLLEKCVSTKGVLLLVKSIEPGWMDIFNSYARGYPRELSFHLAKARNSKFLYLLHKKIYTKFNVAWALCYRKEVMDRYSAKAFLQILPRVSSTRVYPICSTIIKMALRTLESGICFPELLKLLYKLLKINHTFTFKYVSRLLTITSHLLEIQAELFSSAHATRYLMWLILRVISLARFSVDEFIHSVPFLRLFIRYGINGGSLHPIVEELQMRLLRTNVEELKLHLVNFVQLFFGSECWDFGAVDQEERKREIMLVSSQKKRNMITRVFYQPDSSRDETTNQSGKFIHQREVNLGFKCKFRNGRFCKRGFKEKAINEKKFGGLKATNEKAINVKTAFYRIKIHHTNQGYRIKGISKYGMRAFRHVDKEIAAFESVAALEIPENSCQSDKLYKLNMISFFTTISSGYEVEKYGFKLEFCKVPAMVLCVNLLRLPSVDSPLMDALNMAISRQICQATKSECKETRAEAIIAMGKILNG